MTIEQISLSSHISSKKTKQKKSNKEKKRERNLAKDKQGHHMSAPSYDCNWSVIVKGNLLHQKELYMRSTKKKRQSVLRCIEQYEKNV